MDIYKVIGRNVDGKAGVKKNWVLGLKATQKNSVKLL